MSDEAYGCFLYLHESKNTVNQVTSCLTHKSGWTLLTGHHRGVIQISATTSVRLAI